MRLEGQLIVLADFVSSIPITSHDGLQTEPNPPYGEHWSWLA